MTQLTETLIELSGSQVLYMSVSGIAVFVSSLAFYYSRRDRASDKIEEMSQRLFSLETTVAGFKKFLEDNTEIRIKDKR